MNADTLQRPYSTDALRDLTDRDAWDTITPRSIPVEALRTTHDLISAHRLVVLARGGEPEGGDRYPHIVKHGSCLYVHDGHHRVALARLRRDVTICARVVDEDGRPA